MKRLKSIIIIAFALVFLLAACGVDFKIITKIHTDGSCERIMIARGDSSKLDENLFPVKIDSSWTKNIKWEFDTIENKKMFILTASKTYKSTQAMNKEFNKDPSINNQPNITQNLKKKFRWFYTKYEYKETYKQHFPYRYYPLSDYLTQKEINIAIYNEDDSIFYSGKDSVEIKKIKEDIDMRAMNFINDNVFEEFYQELYKAIKNTEIQELRQFNIQNEKKTIHNLSVPKFKNIFSNEKDSTVLFILSALDSNYKTNAFTQIIQSNPVAFQNYERKLKMESLYPFENYKHYLYMPGTLINTNAHKIEEGIPTWKIELGHYIYTDYTMWAESKKMNVWAYVITGIFIILVILSAIISKKHSVTKEMR